MSRGELQMHQTNEMNETNQMNQAGSPVMRGYTFQIGLEDYLVVQSAAVHMMEITREPV
jgi:hypothetical protein